MSEVHLAASICLFDQQIFLGFVLCHSANFVVRKLNTHLFMPNVIHLFAVYGSVFNWIVKAHVLKVRILCNGPRHATFALQSINSCKNYQRSLVSDPS